MAEQISRPAPVVLSFITCEKVIFDQLTMQYSLINTMPRLLAPGFPTRFPPFFVFIELTSGHGVVPVAVKVVDPDEQVLFDAPGKIDCVSPLALGQTILNVPPLPFPRAGVYRVQFWCYGMLLVERPLMVAQAGGG